DAKSNRKTEAYLMPMTDIHLYANYNQEAEVNGNGQAVSWLFLIAFFILSIAWTNYINLATARSLERAKEVGVRKVMGSDKGMLIGQFMVEAFVMSFLSVLFAVGIVALVLPAFNRLVEKHLVLNLFSPVHIISLIVIGLLCGLIAGSYPAFYLSSFNPIKVLKGIKLKTGNAAFVRKGLVVAQFVISVALIICTIIIYEQVMHTKDRELGMNKDNLIYMSQQLISVEKTGDMGSHFEAMKNELLATGVVENASLSNNHAFNVGSNSGDFTWPGKDPKKMVLTSMEWTTPEYISTMGMQIMAGRDFYQSGSGDSNNVVINEILAKMIDSKKPVAAIGKIISGQGADLTIVGIIKDFVYNNVYGSAAPLIIFNDAKEQYTSTLTIRFKTGTDYKQNLAKAEAVIKKINPAYPFEYSFVDDEFEKLFKSETLVGTLASVFAGLAIFISCLGLFGLAAYTAERRIKEIGIRKVLGASVQNLTALLSKDFLKLVIISCIIASPMAWYFMNGWLQDYEYRINISWWMFALPALLAVAIALITVSFQAIKAAIANPVKSLRTE
ncbi:MAG: FtsX-like permease family protein, partial [Ginsengibacter sp.]